MLERKCKNEEHTDHVHHMTDHLLVISLQKKLWCVSSVLVVEDPLAINVDVCTDFLTGQSKEVLAVIVGYSPAV